MRIEASRDHPKMLWEQNVFFFPLSKCPHRMSKLNEGHVVSLYDFSHKKVLGEGMFGKVLLVKRLSSNEDVALKVVITGLFLAALNVGATGNEAYTKKQTGAHNARD